MKNIKYLIGIIIGMAVMYGISSAYNLNANLVTYDKKNSTLESENVQGALNELGVLATTRITSLENEISNGKSVISKAITDKGVTTFGNDFESLASSVSKVYDKGYSLGDTDGYNRGYSEGAAAGYKYIVSEQKVIDDYSGTVTFNLKDLDPTATKVIDYYVTGTTLSMGVNAAPPWWVNGVIHTSISNFVVSAWASNSDSNTWHTSLTNARIVFIYI